MSAYGVMPLYSKVLKKGKLSEVDHSELIDRGIIQRVNHHGLPLVLQVYAWDEQEPGNPDKNPLINVEVYTVNRGGTICYLLKSPTVFDVIYTDNRVHRYTQEIVFGKAAYQLLKTLRIIPDILHLNEAHTVVAAALVRADEEFRKTAIVYTNHTIVPAGLEIFREGEVQADVRRMYYQLGLPAANHRDYQSAFLRPNGVVDFCHAASELADVINGVSREHANITEELFKTMYGKNFPIEVLGVLNGSGKSWKNPRLLEIEKGNRLAAEDELWEIHEQGKQDAFAEVKARTGITLDANKPTIWVIRRIVEYKSQYFMLRFIVRLLCAEPTERFSRERLKALWLKDTPDLKNTYHKQLVEQVLDNLFAGQEELHGSGMQMVVGGVEYEQFWVEEFKRWAKIIPGFVYVPDADIKLLRMQAIGADICVNMPRPLEEASGTSEKRNSHNGGVNIALRGAGFAEWITDYNEATQEGSGFLFGPYTILKPEGLVADLDVFYSQGPVDIFRKAEVGARLFFTEPDKWKKLMHNSYVTAMAKVTAKAMEEHYANSVYGLALKKRNEALLANEEKETKAVAGLIQECIRLLSVASGGLLYYDLQLSGWTVIAGTPHFDPRKNAGLYNWGRDTFISLPGLTFVTGQYSIFKAVFRNYLHFVKNGLLPNFIGDGQHPRYNSVDSALWLFWALEKYLAYTHDYAFLDEVITLRHPEGKVASIFQILEGIITRSEERRVGKEC